MGNKPALGKGLASLLSNAALPIESTATADKSIQSESGTGAVSGGVQLPVEISNRDRHPGISIAKLEEIKVNPYQPRREFDAKKLNELCKSIEANGIIQPLVVRKTEKGLELIAGERRLRAATQAGLKTVPVVIRKSTDRESLELALIENIQRADLNCIDEALGYFQLVQDFNLKQDEVAKRVGKDRATIANHLRLLKLPEQIIEDLKATRLSLGHGKAITGLDRIELQMKVRNEVVEKKLSVRDTENLVAQIKEADQKEGKTAALSEASAKTRRAEIIERLRKLSQEMTRHWAMKVDVKGTEKRGKIVIRYRSRDDLEKAIEALQRNDLWQNPSI